jgi:hypothetical protein
MSNYFQTCHYTVIDAPYSSLLDRQALIRQEGYWISRRKMSFLPTWKYSKRGDIIAGRLNTD